MGWPQYTVIGMFALSWLIAISYNGTPMKGVNGEPAKYSAGVCGTRIALWSFLLWQGGFFG